MPQWGLDAHFFARLDAFAAQLQVYTLRRLAQQQSGNIPLLIIYNKLYISLCKHKSNQYKSISRQLREQLKWQNLSGRNHFNSADTGLFVVNPLVSLLNLYRKRIAASISPSNNPIHTPTGPQCHTVPATYANGNPIT